MKFKLPENKTKIVCTIGYASNSDEMLERLIRAGMNVARINFSHGTLNEHRRIIEKVRRISKRMGKVVAILADLPGPNIRIGKLAKDRITLSKGEKIAITTKECLGDENMISCTYRDLISHVSKGSLIYLCTRIKVLAFLRHSYQLRESPKKILILFRLHSKRVLMR
jgi:pyruvate kinase